MAKGVLTLKGVAVELRDVLIATVLGGIFHIEDAVFESDLGSFVKGLDALIRKTRKAGKIKHDYYTVLIDQDETRGSNARNVGLKCADEEKVTLQISKTSVIYNIGAVIKQGNLFRKGHYLREVSVLMDEILRYRKMRKCTDAGVFPTFAIPFSKEIAPDVLSRLLFADTIRAVGLPKHEVIEHLAFKGKTRHKNVTISTEIRSSDDRSAIVVDIDIRAAMATNIKSYDDFLLQVQPSYRSVCGGLIQRLIRLDSIDEKLLTTNVKSA